jgi:hypothetical protein
MAKGQQIVSRGVGKGHAGTVTRPAPVTQGRPVAATPGARKVRQLPNSGGTSV